MFLTLLHSKSKCFIFSICLQCTNCFDISFFHLTTYILLHNIYHTKLVTEFCCMFIFYIFNLVFIIFSPTFLIIYIKFFTQYWLKEGLTKLFSKRFFKEKVFRFTSQVVISQGEVETHYVLYVYKACVVEWVKSSNWFSYLKKNLVFT